MATSAPSSPKTNIPTSNNAAATGAVAAAAPMDTSIESWIYNIRFVLHFPITILTVAVLLVAGTFAETAPRKSLEFLNNYLGKSLFFILPIVLGLMLDWPTGLLAATVCMIFFARLLMPDSEEGFDDKVVEQKETEIIPNHKRWFVESVLGESPIAISSNKIRRVGTEDIDARTSSSSAMSSTGTSDGSSNK